MFRRTRLCNVPELSTFVVLVLVCSFCFFSTIVTADLVDDQVRIPDVEKKCSNDEDCGNFREICVEEICMCSRFHKWDSNEKECKLQLEELERWLASMKEEIDHKGELDAEAKTVFFQLGIAGVLAVIFGAVGALGCVFTFCFIKSIKQRRKRNKRKSAEEGDTSALRPLPPLPEEETSSKKAADGDAGLSVVADLN